MILAALQLPGRGGTPAEREEAAASALTSAVGRGAEMAVLPEAYFPGYTRGSADGSAEARRFGLARASEHRVTLIVGFLWGRAGRTTCALGVATPDGAWTIYEKRFPSPAESKGWSPGHVSVIVPTPVGRVGVLVCADVLHAASWSSFAGQVDVVAVSAAWPDYRGRLEDTARLVRPAVGWVYAESGPHRDRLLAMAAGTLRVPVLFANACGGYRGQEGFSGGSAIWDGDGRCLVRAGAGAEVVTAAVATGGCVGRSPGQWDLHGSSRWVALAEVGRAVVRLRR